MISSQRQHLILSRLRTRGAVRITALSKELGVSAMTIRRDIADLADKGLLKRVHGGAVSTSTLLSEPLFSVKSQMDIGLKDAIAQEAVKYVAPGDVIAIGGGTTAYVFAQHLLESQQSSGITILTNSIPVAELVQALESKDVDVIVTGASPRAPTRSSGRSQTKWSPRCASTPYSWARIPCPFRAVSSCRTRWKPQPIWR